MNLFKHLSTRTKGYHGFLLQCTHCIWTHSSCTTEHQSWVNDKCYISLPTKFSISALYVLEENLQGDPTDYSVRIGIPALPRDFIAIQSCEQLLVRTRLCVGDVLNGRQSILYLTTAPPHWSLRPISWLSSQAAQTSRSLVDNSTTSRETWQCLTAAAMRLISIPIMHITTRWLIHTMIIPKDSVSNSTDFR